MKKTIVAITMSLLLVAMPVVAGNGETESVKTAGVPANEVSLCYGRVSLMHLAAGVGGVLGSSFSLGSQVMSSLNTTGAIGLEYFHYFAPHFALGGGLVGESLTMTFKKRVTDESGTAVKDDQGNYVYEPGGSQTTNVLTVMPGFKFPWFYKEHVSMYSTLYAGVSMSLGSDFSASFMGHASLVGVDFGNSQWRGFTEFGIGAKGLLNLGLRYNF